jgi:hypothetical protein
LRTQTHPHHTPHTNTTGHGALELRDAGGRRPEAEAAHHIPYTTTDQLRAVRGARAGANYWPPFAPWVQRPVRSWVGNAVGLGVVRGVQLGPWAAGFGGR